MKGTAKGYLMGKLLKLLISKSGIKMDTWKSYILLGALNLKNYKMENSGVSKYTTNNGKVGVGNI